MAVFFRNMFDSSRIFWTLISLVSFDTQMNELYRKVIEQQAMMAQQRVQNDEEKPKYEYDSDEDTEGGTWEHKKRKKEMMKTEGT